MEYRTKSTRQDLQRKYNNETMNSIQQKALSVQLCIRGILCFNLNGIDAINEITKARII
jgi:hypothetical protein